MMTVFKGNSRIFDKPITESSESTSINRIISLFGVTSYEQLTDAILCIKSNLRGTTSATLNVNNLGAKTIKIYSSGVQTATLPENWIGTGQLYYVFFDGVDFIVFSTPGDNQSSGLEVTKVSSLILKLTDSSTADEITEAFGGEDVITDFMNAIENDGIIQLTFNPEISSTTTNIVVAQRKEVSDTETKDVILVHSISESVGSSADEYIFYFTRNDEGTSYSSVMVVHPSSGGDTQSPLYIDGSILEMDSTMTSVDIMNTIQEGDAYTVYDAITSSRPIKIKKELVGGALFMDVISSGTATYGSDTNRHDMLYVIDVDNSVKYEITLTVDLENPSEYVSINIEKANI